MFENCPFSVLRYFHNPVQTSSSTCNVSSAHVVSGSTSAIIECTELLISRRYFYVWHKYHEHNVTKPSYANHKAELLQCDKDQMTLDNESLASTQQQ